MIKDILYFIILIKFHHSLIVHQLLLLDNQLLVLLLASIILASLHLSIELLPFNFHLVNFIGLVLDVRFQVAFQDAAVVGNVPFVATNHMD